MGAAGGATAPQCVPREKEQVYGVATELAHADRRARGSAGRGGGVHFMTLIRFKSISLMEAISCVSEFLSPKQAFSHLCSETLSLVAGAAFELPVAPRHF